jgi:hypothetical protein
MLPPDGDLPSPEHVTFTVALAPVDVTCSGAVTGWVGAGGAMSRARVGQARLGGVRSTALAPLLAAVVALAIGTAGCSGQEKPTASKAFCRAADDYNTELERARRTGTVSVQRQLPLVEALARTAPKAVADDARTFAAALRRLETDKSVRDDRAVKRAVDNVNRFANQACNVYNRDSGL